MRLKNYLRTTQAIASSVCCTNYFHLGKTGSCARWWHWHHPVLHAQRENRLSWRDMRFQKGRRRRQSMVVHQQYCPQVGHKPVNHKNSPYLLCHCWNEIISNHKYTKWFPVFRYIMCRCMSALQWVHIFSFFLHVYMCPKHCGRSCSLFGKAADFESHGTGFESLCCMKGKGSFIFYWNHHK